jgi:hypothetical protein
MDPTLERDMENRGARLDQKDWIPTPQFPNAAFASDAACATLTGRIGVLGTESHDVCSLTLDMFLSVLADEDSSASDFDISTGVPLALLAGSEFSEVELAVRCCHRPRTPSTALKKFVEPVVMVREIASRVGASCCSNFSS